MKDHQEVFNSLNVKVCYHTEASQLISRANQLTGFYIMTTLAFNEVRYELVETALIRVFS